MDAPEKEVMAAETVQTENVETPVINNEAETASPDIETSEAENAEDTDFKARREEVVEQFRQLIESGEEEIRERADQLKSQFYRLYHQEQDAARKQWEELGNNLEDFAPAIDELEQHFRELLNEYKQRRAEAVARREAQEQQNLLRKENIIAQMKEMSENETAEVGDDIKKMRELREEWKQIGQVPATEVTRLWKEYNLYQERFYDLVKINNELREYDFKKNLDLKNAIIEQAEALKEKKEVVEAFRMLQQLHDEWANIGPVARELREDLWNRFKDASTAINRRHQEYFEQLHAQEADNEQKKRSLIEELKALDLESVKTSKQWDSLTEKVQTIQQEWRKIGFAPKKVNQQIYDEYRKLVDGFFTAKTNFYKTLKSDFNKNLEKKQALIRHAQEWKESTDWKVATDKFVQLQKEWKETGQVARKYSDDLWKQFSEACNYFFEQKKAAGKDRRSEEKDNLQKKQDILKEMQELAVTTKDETLEKMGEIAKRFQSIGFVPFREKDKLMKAWHEATDKVFDQLHIDARNRRLEDFQKQVEEKDENVLMGDRRRLVRRYEALQQDIQTAENNILFFSANSKKSSKLIEDMQRKIADQKRELADLEAKINMIDEKI